MVLGPHRAASSEDIGRARGKKGELLESAHHGGIAVDRDGPPVAWIQRAYAVGAVQHLLLGPGGASSGEDIGSAKAGRISAHHGGVAVERDGVPEAGEEDVGVRQLLLLGPGGATAGKDLGRASALPICPHHDGVAVHGDGVPKVREGEEAGREGVELLLLGPHAAAAGEHIGRALTSREWGPHYGGVSVH